MTNIVKAGPPGAGRSPQHQPTSAVHRLLVALELITAVVGIIGGVLLVAAPDGSLLHADMSALHGTPFSDWRVPGVLLLVLVGGGFLLTSAKPPADPRHLDTDVTRAQRLLDLVPIFPAVT